MKGAKRGGIRLILCLGFLFLGVIGLAFAYYKNFNLMGTPIQTLFAKDTSPSSLPKEPGSNEVSISSQNTVNAEEKPTSVTPSVAKITLTVSSDPEAVEIYVDGKFSGVTPILLTYPKEEKTVTIQFKKEGYVGAEQVITLANDLPIIARLSPKHSQKKRQQTRSKPRQDTLPNTETEDESKIKEKKVKIRGIVDGRDQ